MALAAVVSSLLSTTRIHLRAQCGIEPQYFNSENQINYAAEVSPSCAKGQFNDMTRSAFVIS